MSFIFLRNRVTGGAAFSPASLFSSGEEGAWFEPSTTTCFTDTAGTTAASVGDSVALLLDKSQQQTFNARRNLLTYSEDFQNAVWINDNSTFSFTTGQSDPFSGSGATLLEIINTASNEKRIRQTVTHTANQTFSVYLKNDDQRYAQLRVAQSSTNWAAVAFDLQTGTQGTTAERVVGNYVSSGITDVGGGWYRCTLTVGFAATSLFCIEMVSSASPTRSGFGGAPITGTLGAGFYVIGAQWEDATSASAYQAVTTLPVEWAGNHATQASSAARPLLQQTAGGLYYLAFDGSDDGMATASIDFTATDKMSVFAGVEKILDGPLQIFAEISSSVNLNNGSFFLGTNVQYSEQFGFAAKGSIFKIAAVSSGFSAPVTSVLTGLANIADDNLELRIDGNLEALETQSLGTGNFGDYPLNIGVRDAAGTPSRFFNGKLFSLIVRGAASTAQEISDTESYLAAKTGVTIP